MAKKDKAVYRIDLFKQWDAFDRLCLTDLAVNGITAGYRSVYFALLRINNDRFWSEIFEVDFQYIKDLSRADKDVYRNAMNFFNQNGLFNSYEKGVNHYSRAKVSLKVLYGIPPATPTAKPDANAVSKGVTTPTAKPDATTVSATHSIKTVDGKPETSDQKQESVNESPSAFLIFNFLIENTKDEDWTEKYCREKSKYFETWFKNNWQKIEAYGWQKKLAEFIKSEKDAETNTSTTKPGNKFKDTWDPYYYDSLAWKDKNPYVAHLKSLGYKEKYNPGGLSYSKEEIKSLIPEPTGPKIPKI